MIEQIEIKGIVRNTTKQNSENGSMEEIVNLRRRDGNLEPMTPEQEIWNSIEEYTSQFSQLFIHNGKKYKHLLGIMVRDSVTALPSPYNVIYIGDIVDSEEVGDDGLCVPNVSIKFVDTGIKVDKSEAIVHQIGNLLTIHSGEKLQYMLWTNNKYTDVTINWSGSQWDTEVAPDFHIELRSIPHCDKEGNPLLFAVGGSMGEGHVWNNYTEDNITTQGVSSIVQARALAREIGVLNGYCIAITALNLYDGSCVCAGKPVLIPKALANVESEGDESLESRLSNMRFRLNKNAKSKMYGNSNAAASAQGEGTFYYETTYHNTNYRLYDDSNKVKAYGKVTPPKSAFAIVGACSTDDSKVYGVHLKGHNLNDLSYTLIDEKDSSWGVITGNDLQIKFPKELKDARLEDVVKSVSVFITDEEPESEMYNESHYVVDNQYSTTHSAKVYLENTEDKKIAGRLADKSVFYEVYNKNIREIITDTWQTIDLSQKLSILEQQKVLEIDASSTRSTILPDVSYLYNGRLHLGNIKQDTFKGFPLGYFEMSDVWDVQYAKTLEEKCNIMSGLYSIAYDSSYQESELWKGWVRDEITLSSNVRYTYVIAHIETADGWQRVGRIEPYRGNGKYYTLNPMLYYPDSRCRLLQIGTIEGVGANVKSYCTFFLMKGFKAVEGSVHVSLSPIDWYNNAVEVQGSIDPQVVISQLEGHISEEATIDEHFVTNKPSDWAISTEKTNDADVVTFKATSNINNKRLCTTGTNHPAQAIGMSGYQWTYTGETEEDYYKYLHYKHGDDGIVLDIKCGITWSRESDALSFWTIKQFVITIPRSVTLEEMPFTLDFSVKSTSTYRTVYTFSNASNEVIADEYKTFVLNAEKVNALFDIDSDGVVNGIKEINAMVYRPNVLKVSAVETPLFFPAANTYQIGNGEIRGVCANTTALSVGQWGDAPLFVFASDGIYGLFVDANGELVYASSRPISREVCNNPKSITPIDEAIVFSSERGLMAIAGSEVTELSQPIEGKVLKFATADTNAERLDSAKKLLGFEDIDKVAWVDLSTMPTDEEAKEYLRNAIIGYNYDNREIWVANPAKDYIYVFTQGTWCKSKKKIDSFICDYPKTYALLADNKVIDISRGTRRPTECFFLTRPIVIEGENAKHFQKVWLYGDFNVFDNEETAEEFVDALENETDERKAELKVLLKHKAGLFVYGSADGARYSMIGCGGVDGVARNIVSKVHRMSLRYIRILFVGKLEHDSRIESLMVEYKQAYGQQSTIKPR